MSHVMNCVHLGQCIKCHEADTILVTLAPPGRLVCQGEGLWISTNQSPAPGDSSQSQASYRKHNVFLHILKTKLNFISRKRKWGRLARQMNFWLEKWFTTSWSPEFNTYNSKQQQYIYMFKYLYSETNIVQFLRT